MSLRWWFAKPLLIPHPSCVIIISLYVSLSPIFPFLSLFYFMAFMDYFVYMLSLDILSLWILCIFFLWYMFLFLSYPQFMFVLSPHSIPIASFLFEVSKGGKNLKLINLSLILDNNLNN